MLIAPGLLAAVRIDACAVVCVRRSRCRLHERSRWRGACRKDTLWRYGIYSRHKFIHGTTFRGAV